MLSFVTQCFLVSCIVVNGLDVNELTRQGRQMSSEAAAAMETELKENPHDVSARTTLLAYYFKARYRDQTKAETHRQHILWLVENAPESEVLGLPCGRLDSILEAKAFGKANKLWLKHLDEKGESLSILRNASQFFTFTDREKTEELLKRGANLAPQDPAWPTLIDNYGWNSSVRNG